MQEARIRGEQQLLAGGLRVRRALPPRHVVSHRSLSSRASVFLCVLCDFLRLSGGAHGRVVITVVGAQT